MIQERRLRSLESEAKRARAISLVQGGTMIKVLPLVRQGLSISEISQQLGKSYYAVVGAKTHLRKWGDIPSSAREFRRQLAPILENPPQDFSFRKSVLNMVNFDFYREHPKLFITLTKLLRLAGVHLSSWEMSDAVVLLEQAKVPVRPFLFKIKENDEIVYRNYRIILAADQEDGARALIEGYNFRQPSRPSKRGFLT